MQLALLILALSAGVRQGWQAAVPQGNPCDRSLSDGMQNVFVCCSVVTEVLL